MDRSNWIYESKYDLDFTNMKGTWWMDKLFLKNVHFLKLFSAGIIFDNITLNFKEMLNPQKSIIQTAGQLKDYISGCGTFSFNSQSVSLLCKPICN